MTRTIHRKGTIEDIVSHQAEIIAYNRRGITKSHNQTKIDQLKSFVIVSKCPHPVWLSLYSSMAELVVSRQLSTTHVVGRRGIADRMGKSVRKTDTPADQPSQFSFFQLILFVIATSALALSVSIVYGLVPLQGKIFGPIISWCAFSGGCLFNVD